MMASPEISKRKKSDVGDTLPKINCTPKDKKISKESREFCLYKLHRESSPNFRAGQDVLEVGWGDSPEPLNVQYKFEPGENSCKKKLDTRESPKSSITCKRRNIRSTFSLPTKSIIDVAKYVAEVQELSKNIMKEFSSNVEGKDLFANEPLRASTNNIEDVKCRLSPSVDCSLKTVDPKSENKDSAFDNVLQTFINEEDEWLSQALSSQEVIKTPRKSFVKSKSENELTLPISMTEGIKSLPQTFRSNNNNNNFRRTSSFDLTKPSSNNNNNDNINNNLNGNSNKYSLQEIERKRLEAKYRRERREIERKKLEALKKLEMKKIKAIKT